MRTSLLLLIIIIAACQTKDDWDENKFFDPPTGINTKDLQELGYSYVDEWSWYNEVNGDTAFIYQTHFNIDPVFSRFIHINNWKIQDSLGIKKFVESKNGALISPLFRDASGTRFFVQGKSSGQFFRCSLTQNHLFIEFHYPDNEENIRSKYRKPSAEGFTIELIRLR